MTSAVPHDDIRAVSKRLDDETFWRRCEEKGFAVIDVCKRCLNAFPLCGLVFKAFLSQGRMLGLYVKRKGEVKWSTFSNESCTPRYFSLRS